MISRTFKIRGRSFRIDGDSPKSDCFQLFVDDSRFWFRIGERLDNTFGILQIDMFAPLTFVSLAAWDRVVKETLWMIEFETLDQLPQVDTKERPKGMYSLEALRQVVELYDRSSFGVYGKAEYERQRISMITGFAPITVKKQIQKCMLQGLIP